MAQHNVHFKWMGSNKHIATTFANNNALFGYSSATHLQSWLAPQFGIQQRQWYKVIVYFDQRRLTNDALISVPDHHDRTLSCAHFMPQTAEAWRSFLEHARTATADIVLLVTRCSDADCNAAHVLASTSAYNSDVQTMLSKYANNVAFMIRAVSKWPDQVFKQATESMQRNELFAAAAVATTRRIAPLIDPQLWRKASFVLLAACNNNADCNTVFQFCGDNLKKDKTTVLSLVTHHPAYLNIACSTVDYEFLAAFNRFCSDKLNKDRKTMLRLVTHHPSYINIAAAGLDFEFLVEAAALNHECLWFMKDAKAARKVVEASPRGSVAQTYLPIIKMQIKEAACSIL